jgi:uncharacterized protein
MPLGPSHLLYLHGFRSSPRSFKAQRLLGWLQAHRPEVHAWCPQLPASPRAAIAQVMQGVAGWPATAAVVGSSLGGFYATVVAEATGWPAVLINPAVDPARDLAAHIGEHPAWHDPAERLVFAPHFVDELRALHPAAITRRSRYLPIVATGDEVLDWREMVARYPSRDATEPLLLVQGSDHALSDFDTHLPRLLQHLNLT